MPFSLDGDGDGWTACDFPLSPARPACDCQPVEPLLYPGASCTVQGVFGLCRTGSYNCAAGTGTCQQTVFPVAEICDGLDNNCDGQIDEGNPGGGAACLTGIPGICMNGLTTCSGGAILCQQTVLPQIEVCDGLDNNCNGAVDEGLGSTTCGLGQCLHTVQNCVGGVPQICNPMQGAVAEVCNDGLDNDCDGLTDCADPNCAASPFCVVPVENCTNGVDDNANGLIDCADPVCNGQACGAGCICAAGVRTETLCSDGIDNDSDGQTDCADPNCAADPSCIGGEVCNDGIDNNGNGAVDCLDEECIADSNCTPWNNACPTIGSICLTGYSDPCMIGTCMSNHTCKPVNLSCY